MTLVIRVTCLAADSSLPGFEEPKLQRVTCYYANSGITASGTTPKMGRTVGARKDLIGCVCLIYKCNADGSIGDLIDMFQVEDTGSHPRIQNGSIDVYRETYQQCKDWVSRYGDYCWVQIVHGEG